jgi:hypothetical protein
MIETFIPNLLNYPLREFRAHEVKIATLEDDRVVIVVDVGDSKLAPHQTNFGDEVNLYYQRYGSHSVPAEHHNIFLMFGRSGFPSKDVASSWIHTVINPLLDYLKSESENLNRKRRQWENDKRYYFLHSVTPYDFLLNKEHSSICDLDTLEQFFEFTSKIEELLFFHDEIVKKIEDNFSNFYRAMKKTSLIKKYFKSVTTPKKLLEIAILHSELKDIPVGELYSKLFNSRDDDQNLDFITILMLNKHKKWRGDRVFDLFWEKEGENFVSLLDRPSLAKFDQKIDLSYEHLYSVNEQITQLLKNRRRELSIEYGIPVR